MMQSPWTVDDRSINRKTLSPVGYIGRRFLLFHENTSIVLCIILRIFLFIIQVSAANFNSYNNV